MPITPGGGDKNVTINKINIFTRNSSGFANKSFFLKYNITNTVSGTQGWIIREDTDFYLFQLWFGEMRNYDNTLYGAVTDFKEPIELVWIYLFSNNVSFLDTGCFASTNGIVEIKMTLHKQFIKI